MSKIEKRRTSARELVEAIKGVIAHLPARGSMNVAKILRESAAAMNEADRNLLDVDDIGMAIANVTYHHCRMDWQASEGDLIAAHEACKRFGLAFAHALDSQAENFAPGSRQWNLLRQTILTLLNEQPLSVSQLASRAGVDRSAVLRDIQAGRLLAEKIGSQYIIAADAAATWLANPQRGSRSK